MPLAAYSIHAAEGWSWLAIGGVFASVVAVAGALDVLTSRVELRPEHLVVVTNLMRRDYLRSELVGASWAKGGPVTLQFKSGACLRLPTVGSSSQGVSSSVRAWLGSPSANAD